MPDTLKTSHDIWVFGTKKVFKLYDCGLALDPFQYRHSAAGPERSQKNQIVLHCTAGFGPGRGSVDWWNTLATKFHCSTPGHAYFQAAAGNCPVHGTPLIHKYGSAHYIVEREQDRVEPGREYTDVIEVVDSDYYTFHGESVNRNSIGIEHANRGRITPPAGTDPNTFLRLTAATATYAGSNLTAGTFPHYQEEQYLAMILLLRHLCVKHRIPRRLLGDTTREKLMRWHNQGALIRSRLMRFRGILGHTNCHNSKECPSPAVNRNRLFRGIIDEWWLPMQLDGTERTYYMGPFDPQANQASYFRWVGGALQAHMFRDANIDALNDTKSFYDLDQTEWYYAQTESLTTGGTFPIGTNHVWHGGVHFTPPAANRRIYAAASGTIVAARLGSDATIENDPLYGSQRFVLIRHTVYWRREADPGGGQRTDFTTDPTYFFTLYMHLAAPANASATDNNNPPWLNYWLRRNAGGNTSVVFCPNVPVSVGDWLGECGLFRGSQMLHFEVMSNFEMTVAPWNEAQYRAYDADTNAICDVAQVDTIIGRANPGVAPSAYTSRDILAAARELRNVKSYHKSEWALADASALTPVLPDAAARNAKWDKIRFFMWVADAVAACPDLSTQLCDATGMMWHYHPVTFMDFANRLILKENGQVSEPHYSDTNVEMEDQFLTNYVSFTSGSATPAAADGTHVRPFSVSDASDEYHFARNELCCLIPVIPPSTPPAPPDPGSPHDPADNPPKQTRFHLTLLDVIEDIRVTFGGSIKTLLSHVCAGHATAANAAQCYLGTQQALFVHQSGRAIDLRPSTLNLANIRSFWTKTHETIARLQTTCGDHGGEPSRPDLPGHVQRVVVYTDPDVRTALEHGTALTPGQISDFRVHLELIESEVQVRWVAIIAPLTAATAVRTSASDVIGTFPTQAQADSARAQGSRPPWQYGLSWEAVVRQHSRAVDAAIRAPNMVCYYETLADADKEKVSGDAWAEEY